MPRSAPGERAQHARESWAHNDDEESNGTESAATAAAAQSGAAAASHATLAVRDEARATPPATARPPLLDVFNGRHKSYAHKSNYN